MVIKLTAHILGFVRIPCHLILLSTLSSIFDFALLYAPSIFMGELRTFIYYVTAATMFSEFQNRLIWRLQEKKPVTILTCSNFSQSGLFISGQVILSLRM